MDVVVVFLVDRLQQSSAPAGWNPELFVANAIKQSPQDVEEFEELDADGKQYKAIKIRLHGTYFQQMNMVEFPFDVQVDYD